MILCPLCEHPQEAGDTCDNCGKQLSAPRPTAVATAPLAELEQTELPAARAPVAVSALAELEQTRAGRVEVPVQALPEVERTGAAPVQAPPVQPLPELDLGRAADDGVRTAAPTGAITCRYCRNVQAAGLLCERCGMALPKAKAPAAAARGAAPVRAGDTVWTRCRKCGATARGGERCGDCGHAVPMPEP